MEYYCANKDVLTFPWGNGLRMEQAEQYWEEKKFPDGSDFYDYEHGETGARVFKVQHPEFELWSYGIHASSGVTCADCHMPYERVEAPRVLTADVVESPHCLLLQLEDFAELIVGHSGGLGLEDGVEHVGHRRSRSIHQR